MTIQNPSLTLTFYSASIPTAVTTTSIVRDSIQINEQLYNDLKASSNTVSMQLKPDGSSFIEDIIKDNADIKAELKDGTTPIFTGLLGNDYTWRISQTGEDVFQIKIEDLGTRYLNRPFVTEDNTCIRDTLSSIFNTIKVRCGNVFQVLFDSSVPSSLQNKILINKLSSSKTCKEVLDTICYEFGLIYYFNNAGNLVVKKTSITASPATTVASTGSYPHYLYAENKSSIDLTRKARQYSQARVKYDVLSDSTNEVPIYRVTENIQVPAGQWWDGETHSESIYELTMDEFFLAGKTYYTYNSSTHIYEVATVTVGAVVTPDTYYEYSSAASTVEMTDIDNGKEIIYVYPSSVTPNAEGQTTGLPGYVEATYFAGSKWTLKPHNDTTKLDVLIDNTNGSVSSIYTLFSARGRIIRKQSTSNIYRSVVGLTSNTEVQFNYEAEWIHDKEDAVNLCELLSNYYLYCNNTYTFWCKDDLTLGSIVRVYENLFTDLDINLFLVARQYNAYGGRAGLYKYTAQAVSPFDLETTGRADTNTFPVENQGPQGPSGPSIVTTLQYALTSSSSVQPGTNDWYDTRPTGWYHGMCYWQREKSVSSDGTTTYTQGVVDTAYNNLMEGLVVFKLEATPSTYTRNLRESNNQTIKINVQLDYYPNHCSISAKNERDENIQVTQVVQDKEYTITVNDVNDFDKIIVTGTLSGANPQVLTLNVVDDTEYNRNFGSVSALPSGEILSGDYFFVVSQFTADNYTFETGFPYVKRPDGTWTQLVSDTPENAQRLFSIMGTVLADDETPAVSSPLYGFFQNLASQYAVIQELFSKTITLLQGGSIKSDSLTYDPADNRFVTNGFIFDYDGTAKLGSAYLRNIKLKCTDTQSKILLETQEYQPSSTSISCSPKTTWSQAEAYSSMTNISTTGTYNGGSQKYFERCSVSGPQTFNMYNDSAGWIYHWHLQYSGSQQDTTFTIPCDGYYGLVSSAYTTNGVNNANLPEMRVNGSAIISNSLYDSVRADTSTLYKGAYRVVYLTSGTVVTMHSNTTSGTNSQSNYLVIYPSASSIGMFSSSTSHSVYGNDVKYRDLEKIFERGCFYTGSLVLNNGYSSTINYASIDGWYNGLDSGRQYDLENSTITWDGTSYSIIGAIKSAGLLTLIDSYGNSLEFVAPSVADGSVGWYNITGTLRPVGQNSALKTYNLEATDSTADITGYRNISANKYMGNVNGGNTPDQHNFKVWGAVFN